MMTDSTTVLVVGGGATGTGIARDLSLRGVDVTLVERGGLSSGTSGRSHGLLHSGARYAEADRVGAEECIEENQILRSIAGECIRETGGLFVQLAEDDAEYFDEKRAACEDIGIETELLDADEARERVPDLSAEVERAMWVPDGAIYPSRLGAANAADAEEHGATIHPHAPLEELTVENGAITEATLGGDVGGQIEPQYVVNAAGAWAGQVAALAGLEVQMAPSRGVTLDHAEDGVDNFASIVGGKLTTYRQMAEVTADHVCAKLGVDAECETATRPLPGAEDANRLDELVKRYDGQGPTDKDVVAP